MKKYKIAFLFTQPPFGSAVSREGLDALLAASAFCDETEIAVCFWQEGVFNLVAGQQPSVILQKDHIATFKLLSLYEIDACFACETSLAARGLTTTPLILPQIHRVSSAAILQILKDAEKVLTF